MRDEETAVDELSERQLEGVVALLQNVTVAGASRDSGIPESTLYRWLTQASFKAEYRRQRRMLFERTVGLAQRASSAAMGEVIEIMRSGENEYARLAAARIVLDRRRAARRRD
jgi:transposase-like protein